MKKITEEESIKLYNNFGIAEWREKCLLLEEIHYRQILDDLEKGVNSPLVQLVKLPFPHFITTFLRHFNSEAPGLLDPAFGYKMYMLDDNALRVMFEYQKGEIKSVTSITKKLNIKSSNQIIIDEIKTFLSMDLEAIPKLMSGTDRNIILRKKWMYISQYISAKEAELMNLKGYEFKDNEQYRGCDLEGKLNLLNTALRIVLSKYIGLYGGFRKSMKEIQAELNLFKDHFECMRVLMPYLENKSVDQAKHLLGVVDETLVDGKTRQYENDKIKDLDIKAQINYIKNNLLTDEERRVLEKCSVKQIKIYIGRKYMFGSDFELSEYFNILMQEININKAQFN